MSRFWRATTLGCLLATSVWVAGFTVVKRVYSPLGLAFFGLLAALYYGVGTMAAAPPRLSRSTAAGALSGSGAGFITAAWLYFADSSTHAPSLAAWLNSVLFAIVSQAILGGVVGCSAGWI